MDRRITAIQMVVDLAMLVAAGLAASIVRFGTIAAGTTFENAAADLPFWQLTLIIAPIWLVFLYAERLYDPGSTSVRPGELARVARALSFGLVALIMLTYVLKLQGLSRAWTLIAWAFGVVFVLLGRSVVRLIVTEMRSRGRLTRRTLVVGSNAEAADVIRVLKGSPGSGLIAVGCLASSQAERLSLDFCTPEVPCLGAARELKDIVRGHKVDVAIIVSSAFDHDVLARMIAELRGTGVEINVSSGLFEVLTSRVLIREIGGVPLITVRGVSLSKRKLVTKRAFDLAVASSIVLLGSPAWILIALGIKITSPGPVFYKQQRVGRRGSRFGMYKFRSMVADADAQLKALQAENEASGPLFKMKDDPRVTSIGKWMRKFSIDEFPQLINVLKGEMSLVGPRPPLLGEAEEYTERHWRRMEVLPGMTGLWQVSGRSRLTFDEMVRLDLFYIENWSVSLDLQLMARTVPAVLFARGAY
ncbi:MAG: sugar transferase [Coriobacteriia bacterium]|nr:sugar transferase [Coriobacteriia bacterium]